MLSATTRINNKKYRKMIKKAILIALLAPNINNAWPKPNADMIKRVIEARLDSVFSIITEDEEGTTKKTELCLDDGKIFHLALDECTVCGDVVAAGNDKCALLFPGTTETCNIADGTCV